MSRKKCSVDECGRDSRARGWCAPHYRRWKKHGDPNVTLVWKGAETLSIRFWAKVAKASESECWIWGGSARKGYGKIWAGSPEQIYVSAHRVSWEIAHGPIPDGMDIDHACRNTLCVNPRHLRPATGKQNHENLSADSKTSKSGLRGVHWDKARKKWRGRVKHFGTEYSAGSFETVEEANEAVIALRNELFTHNELDRKAAA